MTVVWRIGVDASAYLADDLSGDGARKAGGRWNSPGRPLLHASTSISLAVLETVVRLDGMPSNRYLVEITIPDAVFARGHELDPVAHVGWDAIPESKTSIDAGDQWLDSESSALLFVPSVVVPEERNVLINPLHADASRIRARKVRKFTYDPRLA
jgi:RES domain-containing protein